MDKATECMTNITRILLGGPCIEEELHNGRVTCMTSHKQSCLTIVHDLVASSPCLDEGLHDRKRLCLSRGCYGKGRVLVV